MSDQQWRRGLGVGLAVEEGTERRTSNGGGHWASDQQWRRALGVGGVGPGLSEESVL